MRLKFALRGVQEAEKAMRARALKAQKELARPVAEAAKLLETDLRTIVDTYKADALNLQDYTRQRWYRASSRSLVRSHVDIRKLEALVHLKGFSMRVRTQAARNVLRKAGKLQAALRTGLWLPRDRKYLLFRPAPGGGHPLFAGRRRSNLSLHKGGGPRGRDDLVFIPFTGPVARGNRRPRRKPPRTLGSWAGPRKQTLRHALPIRWSQVLMNLIMGPRVAHVRKRILLALREAAEKGLS